MGGINLRSLHKIRTAAWCSAFMPSLRYIHKHLPTTYPRATLLPINQHTLPVIPTPILDCQPNLTSTSISFTNIFHDVITSQLTLPTQRDLTRYTDKPDFEDLLSTLQDNPDTHPQAHLLVSTKGEGVSSWLYCGSNRHDHLQLKDAVFRECLRLRLLYPAYPDPVPTLRQCPTCKKRSVHNPFHPLSCQVVGGVRTIKHDLIVIALIDFIKSNYSDRALEIHTEYIIPPIEGSHRTLRADIHYCVDGVSTFIDVMVTSPTGAKNMSTNPTFIPGQPSMRNEQRKIDKYVNVYGVEFIPSLIPFVIESTGRLGPSAAHYIDQVSGADTTDMIPGDRRKQKARSHLLQRLSIILCNGNARQIMGCRSSMEMLPATQCDMPEIAPTLATLAYDDSDDEPDEPDITQT
jgi:hypothetical protein